MDKSHPRFMERLEQVEALGFSYQETSIPTSEGEFLAFQIRDNHYVHTIEIGCALGMASVYICDALAQAESASHTMIDPFQTSQWKSIGVKNVKKLGFDSFTLLEKPSEFALPGLLEDGRQFDFAFIDGWHTFDHTLLDFFYLNRLIRVGGMIVFDDVKYPAVAKVVKYVANYPNYQLVPDKIFEKRAGKRVALVKKTLAWGQVLSRCVPKEISTLCFADGLLSRQPIHDILLTRPRWIAFRKTGEDHRDFDWFKDF